jgi:excisionase family DNA binding protein
MAKVITVAEAAERLGVHHMTIRRWIREGRLRAFRVGDVRRYVDAEEVEALREPQELPRRREDDQPEK